jgi:PAS domain S-box-containing protein
VGATSVIGNVMSAHQSGPDSVTDGGEFLEERFRLLVESLADYAVFMIDVNGTIASWNQGVEHVLGYAAAEFIGLPFATLFTPEDVAENRPQEELATAVRTGRSDDKRDHVRRDGTRFRADGVVTVIRDSAGTVQGFSKVMHDVTAERQAAEELRESEERYRLLVDSVQDYAIFLLDANGEVATWTSGAARMKGYSAEEVVGQHFRMFFTPEDQARGFPELELRRAAADGRFEGEGWRVRKDGTRFWGNEIIAPIRRHDGVRGFAKVVRDLTEKQRAALEREQLYTAAQEANRLKDEFLGTVSHELRTPLNAILGWAHLLQHSDLSLDPAKQTRALAAIERNAQIQVQLVNDLLDVSRIISGTMRLRIAPAHLPAVVHAAVEAVQPAAQAKGVALRVTVDPATTTLVADEDRVQQIVWNLLANAIKFTPAGGTVTLHTRRTGESTDLVVSDTGSGIAPDLIPFVFDRFRQADGSTTRAAGGVGLGLAIVRHLVELHGGQVEAFSGGSGKGATFTVSLPSPPLVPALAAKEPTLPSPPTFEPLPTLATVRVVIVDDNDDTREVLTAILKESGAEVVAAESAAGGLALIAERVPDVIVADIGMPGEDGYAFIERVRRIDAAKSIPAIALTAFARNEDRERALNAGYQLHVAKPFDPRTIVHAVHGIVRTSSR